MSRVMCRQFNDGVITGDPIQILPVDEEEQPEDILYRKLNSHKLNGWQVESENTGEGFIARKEYTGLPETQVQKVERHFYIEE